MKKFLILIEDDFEIMGNGLGNVADLQYIPALTLMNIADKYNDSSEKRWMTTIPRILTLVPART